MAKKNKIKHKCMDRKRMKAFIKDLGKLMKKHQICAWESMFISLNFLTASINSRSGIDPINALLGLLKRKDVPMKYKKSKYTDDPMVG